MVMQSIMHYIALYYGDAVQNIVHCILLYYGDAENNALYSSTVMHR